MEKTINGVIACKNSVKCSPFFLLIKLRINKIANKEGNPKLPIGMVKAIAIRILVPQLLFELSLTVKANYVSRIKDNKVDTAPSMLSSFICYPLC